MAKPSKYLTMSAAVILLIYALAIIADTSAQTTITKPAIPEFTIKYSDYSYDVSPVYGVDPNTDETIVTEQGYHVDNRTVQFIIKNQPFTPYINPSSGKTINLFYNIKYKPTDASSWTSMFGGEREFYAGSIDPNFNPYIQYGFPVQNSTEDFTIITFTYPSSISANAQVDFQVQALAGYTECVTLGESHIFFAAVNYVFYGEKSGWTSTQTVPVSEPAPSVPEVSPFAVLPLFLAVPAVAIILKKADW